MMLKSYGSWPCVTTYANASETAYSYFTDSSFTESSTAVDLHEKAAAEECIADVQRSMMDNVFATV